MEIIYFLIVLLAGLVQGLSGFGFALVATPLLSLFIDLNFIVPVIVLYCLLTNISIMIETYKFIDLKNIWQLILFGTLAIPFGVILLKIVSGTYLQILTGLTIVSSSIIFLKGYNLQIKNQKIANAVVGITSGVLNGSLSMSGPPIAIFFANQSMPKDNFRANMIFYSFVTNIITIISMYLQNLYSPANIKHFIFNIPAVIVGVVVGQFLSRKINQVQFKKIVWMMLLITGLWAMVSALIKILR